MMVLYALLAMILTLMALGAGVRAMNAGLSCPDWPLCFGKVIPDFHPGVYFEFIHRAYAGLVAIVFFGCCAYAFFSKRVPSATKRAAVFGIVALAMQIVMGGLTVLKLIRDYIVTSHLMLATAFFCSVLWMLFSVRPVVERRNAAVPSWLVGMSALITGAIVVQLVLGGFVASTYAGSVCVDWPLCNGQWVPTWRGAIGLQIMHRMLAYSLALAIGGLACWLHMRRANQWMGQGILFWSRMSFAVVIAQIGVGVANLLLYIPPAVTVLHQSVAIVLLATNLRLLFLLRARVERAPVGVLSSVAHPAAPVAPPF